MSSIDDQTGVQVILTNLENNPHCPHGPTLLFRRASEPRSFYACSACRDRKDCKFFLWSDVTINEKKLEIWKEENRKQLPNFHHNTLKKRFIQVCSLPAQQRMYCHTCDSLVLKEERSVHSEHDLLVSITDYQLQHPSELMKPQESSRKEAQYLFASKSTKVIVDILGNAGKSRVLCIGAPRIHEYIRSNFKDNMTSLLLDIDHRYHQFYTRDEFCWFNSFNCHFFEKAGEEVFERFLAGGKSNEMAIVTDPPFGGRVEPLSYSFQKIDQWHLKLHPKRKSNLPVLWIFPYFMEPQILGCNPNMKMHDYKVDYDNHPLFQKGPKGRKQGSPVRIFTSLDTKYVTFPAEEGYRLCEICMRWVSAENKHCIKCESCTSKDGRTYVHCDQCERCVKPTWKHCPKCNRCCLPKHNCGFTPQAGLCFGCHQPGHKKTDCPQRTIQDYGANRARPKKRKSSQKFDKPPQKKGKK